jgi:hypothetical protein
MKCPECGAEVGAGERFCGNCGTPLPASTPDQAPPNDDVEWTPGQDEGTAEEPTPAGPMPLPPHADAPIVETFVPDPAGSPEESTAPPPPPPPPVVTKSSSNRTLIIAIVVLVVLLLCCCIALVVGGLYLSTTEESDLISMLVPNLTATI